MHMCAHVLLCATAHGDTCARVDMCTPVLVFPAMVWPSWGLAPGVCSACLAFPIPRKVLGPSQKAYYLLCFRRAIQRDELGRG